ncbi:hypothetical protein C2S51_029849 [Perilla frutescens var. frutescens]|nr:hypothetical protein C2S51_029849 [Perilla frutescens var. frutescens]
MVLQRFSGNVGSDFYVRVAYLDVDKEKSNIKAIIVLAIASLAAVSVCLVFAWWMWKRKGRECGRETSTRASWRNSTCGFCPVRFQVDVEKNWVYSSKVSALMSELGNLQLAGSKSIVFLFESIANSSFKVLLMSLKAGGVGINLTAVSNAFVMDPWWNPAVEEKAVKRIHRIGQTNRGTVEERMEAVQARKQRMISGAK